MIFADQPLFSSDKIFAETLFSSEPIFLVQPVVE